MNIASLPAIAAGDVPAATRAQMAEVDRIPSTELGIPLATLMENAGRQVAAATRLALGETEGQLIAAIVGVGNNGGDALVALRHLAGWGAEVEAYVAAPAADLRPLARAQLEIAKRLGIAVYDTTTLTDEFISHRLRGRHAVIDGLLGFNASGAPRGEVARLIRLASTGTGPVIVAVDLPSGLVADTGAHPAEAVRADATVTLALPKTGLLRASRDVVGDLLLADIGLPARAFGRVGIDVHGLFGRGDLLRIVS